MKLVVDERDELVTGRSVSLAPSMEEFRGVWR
jgi:hypothetical protein